ncbi:MAG: PQQ-binding-like beta-propeller repeat protein [Opitutae bacterium]|nr:PQQ-binding-like beta-propeller repeat protein [Opitutae bacterium]MBT5379947.1 PQQ-binding-like beta-propeller repeat protein [Opitutae bacterium]
MKGSTGLLVALSAFQTVFSADWPQAAGPNGNFIVNEEAVTSFSVSQGRNVLWRVPLPNTGQGTVIASDNRLFVTSHEVITHDAQTGSLMLGLCFDAKNGRELWRREIPGTRETDFSSLFSDNTAASPVAIDQRVVFTNVGGTAKCFDFDGEEKWSHTWTPFGRHHARQHEPMIFDENVILFHIPRYDLPASASTKSGSHPLGRDREFWTYLQAYSLANGKRQWQAESATSVHSTSILGQLPDGRHAILTGRGGGHNPPEEPYGISLLDASSGKQIRDSAIHGYAAAQNVNWQKDVAHFFVGKEHRSLSLITGELLRSTSLTTGVSLTRLDDKGKYVTLTNQTLPKSRKPITYFTNLIVGDYHYFRSFGGFLIGRVQLSSGRVEYLRVPVQVVRKHGMPEQKFWDKALPNDMKNSAGFRATQDKRNAGNGWGHVSAASPIVVGTHIYFPTMIGMVYVLKWDADVLDADSLISISDLGPAGETWSLSSLSYADGKLFARTMKELVCIGVK